jgi:ubiquinone/menaquinone biosynthesis C-methylase UbiE
VLDLTEREQLTAVVYGDTFALYDDASFDEFLQPFSLRFDRNGISRDVFAGKRCLDAGCGGGRGSIFMAESGAREVIGLDLSPRNVESSRKRADQRGLDNCEFQQASLMEIPFADENFDIVWCNGVLHHTTDPDAGLREITRVLKQDGYLWLYLYGSGGIYWYVVEWIRDQLRGVEVRDCVALLRLMDMPIRRIAEWIDDWFVPYLCRYTSLDVTRRLSELGYVDPTRLLHGAVYDTSERRVGATPVEDALMGEGDLRYFVRKTRQPTGHEFVLPDSLDGRGSVYEDGIAVTDFAQPLAELAHALESYEQRARREIRAERILACRAVHSAVRDLLEQKAAFDPSVLRRQLDGVIDIVGELRASK